MTNQASTTTEGKTPGSVTPGSVTLREVTDDYLEHLAASGARPSTVNIYSNALDLAINHFGADRKLDSITLLQVGKYYAGKEVNVLASGKPKAAPTVKQIKRVFRQCLEFAKEQGLITQLPIPKAELQHARSSKATATVTSQTEAETPESVEAEAPAEAEIQS